MKCRSLFPQTQPLLKSSFTPAHPGLLQRKCACGKAASSMGQCSECQRQKLAPERELTDSAGESEAPPVVHEVLRSSSHLTQLGSQSDFVNSKGNSKASLRNKQGTQADTTQSQIITSPTSEGITGQNSQPQAQKSIPENLLEGPFLSVEQAVEAFATGYNPLSIKKCEEICAIVLLHPVLISINPFKLMIYYFYIKWQHPDPAKRKDTCTAFPTIPPFNGKKPGNFAGEMHTHGCEDSDYENEEFSPADKSGCRQSGGPCFIVTPKGKIRRL